jgi:hypothetical protein
MWAVFARLDGAGRGYITKAELFKLLKAEPQIEQELGYSWKEMFLEMVSGLRSPVPACPVLIRTARSLSLVLLCCLLGPKLGRKSVVPRVRALFVPRIEALAPVSTARGEVRAAA